MQPLGFGDKVQAKAIALAFVAYLIGDAVCMAILIRIWLPDGQSAEQAARLAETAPLVVTGGLFIGAALGIAAGWLVTHLSGATGLKNSLVLGLAFVVFGIVGVFLHPAAPAWTQALNLISPVPIGLAGGYLRLRSSRSTRAQTAVS